MLLNRFNLLDYAPVPTGSAQSLRHLYLHDSMSGPKGV